MRTTLPRLHQLTSTVRSLRVFACRTYVRSASSHTRGVPISTILQGLETARNHATRNGLSTSLIVNFMRERDEEEALELLASVEPYHKQIVAVGIDSSEIGYPPQRFTRSSRRHGGWGLSS